MEFNVKFDYSKLRGRIKEYGFTQGRIAELAGISASTMSLKLNNTAFFTQKEIRIFCDLLDIEDAEIGIFFYHKSSEKLNN